MPVEFSETNRKVVKLWQDDLPAELFQSLCHEIILPKLSEFHSELEKLNTQYS